MPWKSRASGTRGAYSHKRPGTEPALKLLPHTPDQRTMQFLVSNRRTRVLKDVTGVAFALGLIAIVAQSA